MSNKIMTVEDLYSFCLTNNFANFSSDVYGAEIVVSMPATFDKTEKSEDRNTEGMTPFVSNAFHDHINLNKSEIPEETFVENVPSSHLRPILANIVVDEETGVSDFGSHDFDVEIDEDGNEHYIYYERPVGVIDGSKTEIVYDETAKVNRAVLHGFLYDGYCQETIDILNRRGQADCSVELSVRKMSFDTENKVLSLDDFYVNGLTLLGASVKPGMQGSNLKIEDFALNTKVSYEQNPDIVKLLQELSDKLDNLSSYTKENSKEGGEPVTKFEELLSKYNKTVDDIDFDYAEMSDEELEAKFAELFEEGEGTTDPEPAAEPENDPEPTDDGEGEPEPEADPEPAEENFVKTFEISHEDIRTALYGLLSAYEESDNEWYWIEQVYDDHFVYSNWDSSRIYGQKYVKDGDNVSFAEERYELFKELLTASEKAELDSMRANYANYEEISAKLAKYEEEPAKIEIISSNDYAQIAETEEFKAFADKDAHFDMSIDEVKAHLDDMLLAYAKTGNLTFKAIEQPKNVGMKQIPVATKAVKNKRYGNLFANKETE